jgi:aminopeptidase N
MRVRGVVAVLAAVTLAGCSSTPHRAPRPAPSGGGEVPPAYAAGVSHPVADPLYPQHGTDALDVLYYGLDLNWSVTTKTLTGTATLQIRPTRDAASMSLDFKPYHLDRVTVGGAPAIAAVTEEKLVVSTAVRADHPITLVVTYHGRPMQTPMPSKRPDTHPLGLTVGPDGGLWTMQEPFGAFTWYPANDQPSDKALYDIAITVPKGWTGIANGTPAGHTGNTFRYHSADPVATYLTTLAVGEYRETTVTGPHGLPVSLWYHADEAKYLSRFKRVPSYLTWLEAHFGPYPFPSAGMVLVPSDSAMETQQTVTMGNDDLEDSQEYTDGTTMHEFTHQWFGDTVTPAGWPDLWLSEGWALYAQGRYDTDVYHTKPSTVAEKRRSDGRYRKQYGPPAHPKAAEFAAPGVYVCASNMLRQLDQALGDQRFFAMGAAWAQQHRGTNQTRASFTAFVNRFTGHDFTPLINAWLDSPTTPPETGPLPA